MSYPQNRWINIGITQKAESAHQLADHNRDCLQQLGYSQRALFFKLNRNGQVIF